MLHIGILRCTIPMLLLLEHVLEFLLGIELPLEFQTELALVVPPGLALTIPPELAISLVLAHSLDSPDLECALFGGIPPVLAAWYCITMASPLTPTRILRWCKSFHHSRYYRPCSCLPCRERLYIRESNCLFTGLMRPYWVALAN